MSGATLVYYSPHWSPQTPHPLFTSTTTRRRRRHEAISSPRCLWSAPEIAEAVNGRIIKWGPPGTISIDTRSLLPGQWFFPILGPHFDGHDFITPDLHLSKGCAGVIGIRVPPNWEKGFIKIPENDTVISLTKMGVYARDKFGGCTIAITGSVGKTTTKTMTVLALETLGGRVFQSRGNWNNRIGVAMSLIELGIRGNGETEKSKECVVLELGMSGRGEILELARMCSPSIRVILNVSPSHLENFTSLEDLAMAKAEIMREAQPGDVCILNADDPLLNTLPLPTGVHKVLFGRRADSDVRLVVAESARGGHAVRVVLQTNDEIAEFVIPSPGLHLAQNACAAAAIATLLGASLHEVGKALSKFVPVHMRAEVEEVGKNGIKIINDVYNANPASTKAALDLLKGIECEEGGKRVAILGDMLELGPTEIECHEAMLRYCCYNDDDGGGGGALHAVDAVALVGKRYCAAYENLDLDLDSDSVVCAAAADAESLVALEIGRWLRCGDVVLVKGSRGMQMEKVIHAIKALNIDVPH